MTLTMASFIVIQKERKLHIAKWGERSLFIGKMVMQKQGVCTSMVCLSGKLCHMSYDVIIIVSSWQHALFWQAKFIELLFDRTFIHIICFVLGVIGKVIKFSFLMTWRLDNMNICLESYGLQKSTARISYLLKSCNLSSFSLWFMAFLTLVLAK